MKKTIVFCTLSMFAYSNSDYVPLSEMSQSDKIEHNFVKKQAKPQINEEAYKSVEEINIVKDVENIQEIKEAKKLEYINDESKNIETNAKQIGKSFVKEFKKESILKDTKKDSSVFNNSDFSVTPKISYMHVTTNIDKEEIDKTHEIVPEISFAYKNHTLRTDYFNVNIKDEDSSKFRTTWYRLAYLYKFNNANIGLGYNHYKNKGSEPLDDFYGSTNENFPTLEVHFKNTENQLQVEYGGFYGKNDSFIKNAYEYYLSLGYRIFDNDNLIFTAGYKNRTLDLDSGAKLEYKGPTLGISSTF